MYSTLSHYGATLWCDSLVSRYPPEVGSQAGGPQEVVCREVCGVRCAESYTVTAGQGRLTGTPGSRTGARLNRCEFWEVGARTTGDSAEPLPSGVSGPDRGPPHAIADGTQHARHAGCGTCGVSCEKFPACVGLQHVGVQPSEEVLAQNVLRRPPELAVGGLVDDVPAAGGGDDRLHGPGEDGRGLAAIPVQEVRRRLRIIDFGLYSSTQPAGEMCESMSLITTMVSAIAESPRPGRTKGSRGD